MASTRGNSIWEKVVGGVGANKFAGNLAETTSEISKPVCDKTNCPGGDLKMTGKADDGSAEKVAYNRPITKSSRAR